MCTSPTPDQLLDLADGLAAEASGRGDRPYGALLVSPHGEVVVMASDREVTADDATAHAEMLLLRAVRAAAITQPLGQYTVGVNAPPCSMCASALVEAGVGMLIYRDAAGAVVKNSPSVFAAQLSARHPTPNPSSMVRTSE